MGVFSGRQLGGGPEGQDLLVVDGAEVQLAGHPTLELIRSLDTQVGGDGVLLEQLHGQPQVISRAVGVNAITDGTHHRAV